MSIVPKNKNNVDLNKCESVCSIDYMYLTIGRREAGRSNLIQVGTKLDKKSGTFQNGQYNELKYIKLKVPDFVSNCPNVGPI